MYVCVCTYVRASMVTTHVVINIFTFTYTNVNPYAHICAPDLPVCIPTLPLPLSLYHRIWFQFRAMLNYNMKLLSYFA